MTIWNRQITGVIAQLAERYLCKVEDVGSTPIGSTKGLVVKKHHPTLSLLSSRSVTGLDRKLR